MTDTQRGNTWQSLAAEDISREQSPHLRISAAGKCPRAQTYAAMGTPESNPPPPHALNMMALGHMAEVLIIMEMEKNGWETRHTVLSDQGQLELELPLPGADRTVRGHPDGICRHKTHTRDLWVTLECKSMSPDKGIEVQLKGIAQVYPAYIPQISLYGRRLKDMQAVSHGERGVFGIMDREGRVLSPQRVHWERQEVDATLARLGRIARDADEGRLPDRPHAQSDPDCRRCPYYSLCWETDETPEDPDEAPRQPPEPHYPRQAEVLQAAREWAELKPRVDRARDMLQAVSNSHNQADVIAEGVVAGYFQPRSERVYDTDALERVVPADILNQCRVNLREKPPAFWVRTERR